MCGIFGCLVKINPNLVDIKIVKIIYDALSLLKNRGYDSCGIYLRDIENNNIKNVVLNQNAVWTKNEELEFSDEGGDSGSIYSIANTKKVKVQAIDFLEALNKEDKIDMLKMDIEGAENDVIPHIASALYKIDKIFIEYHSFNNGEQRLDEILSLLKQNKFRYYIRHVNNRKSPFIDTAKDKEMDMQLNIFAFKN